MASKVMNTYRLRRRQIQITPYTIGDETRWSVSTEGYEAKCDDLEQILKAVKRAYPKALRESKEQWENRYND